MMPLGGSSRTREQAVADTDRAVGIYWDFENVHACLVDDANGAGTYRRVAGGYPGACDEFRGYQDLPPARGRRAQFAWPGRGRQGEATG
jgi:hypothetical protein